MKNVSITQFSILLLIISTLLSNCTEEVDFDSLVERQNIMYKVNSDKGYTGKATQYHENGQLALQCSFVDGRFENEYQSWFENGQLEFACTYSNYVPVGEQVQYYQSGQLHTKTNFSEGLIDGQHLKFWENGKEKSKGLFVNGEKSGEHLVFSEDGQVLDKESYQIDLLDGESIKYWEDGSIRYSGVYSSGKAIDEHITYFPNHRIDETILYDSLGNRLSREWYFDYKGDTSLYKYTYSQNFEISEKVYTMSGELKWIKEDSTALGINYKRERHYNKGQLFRQKIDDKNEWVYEYTDSGKLSRKYQWKDLKYDGRVISYHDNGKVKSSGYYKAGSQSGLWKWYYESGNIETTGYYEGDERVGTWTYYDDFGGILNTVTR